MKNGEILYKNLNNIREEYLTEVIDNMDKENKNTRKILKKRICIVAAAFIMLAAIPNASPVFAETLGELPVLGRFFQVVTINRVHENNGVSSIEAETPAIVNDEGNPEIEELNETAQAYTNDLIERFEEECADTLGNLDIRYEVVTDTDQWFTLLINSTEIQASGYQRSQYYNIDKSTGEYLVFSEYLEDFDSVKEDINEYIISTMMQEMQENESVTYFIQSVDGCGFESIDEDQNFYINEDGDLVISFDEYDVAPGYMGIVQFTIPAEAYRD